MKFQYIGSENNPPQETTVFGHEFTLNGPSVEVSDPVAVEKLKGNRTFRTVSESKARLPDDIAADFRIVSGMREATQEERDGYIRHVLEAAGAKVDGRWGSARLQAELEKLHGAHG